MLTRVMRLIDESNKRYERKRLFDLISAKIKRYTDKNEDEYDKIVLMNELKEILN